MWISNGHLCQTVCKLNTMIRTSCNLWYYNVDWLFSIGCWSTLWFELCCQYLFGLASDIGYQGMSSTALLQGTSNELIRIFWDMSTTPWCTCFYGLIFVRDVSCLVSVHYMFLLPYFDRNTLMFSVQWSSVTSTWNFGILVDCNLFCCWYMCPLWVSSDSGKIFWLKWWIALAKMLKVMFECLPDFFL